MNRFTIASRLLAIASMGAALLLGFSPVRAAGPAWTIVASANPGSLSNQLNGVSALSTTDIWAVGSATVADGSSEPLVEHWNGTSWSGALGTYSGGLNAVEAISATNIWAVGDGFIVHFNGHAWSLAATVQGSLKGISGTASDLWAAGTLFNGTVDQTVIEHWNGKTWTNVPSPNVGTGYNRLYSITAVSPSNVWAVGSYDDPTTYATLTLIEHWNGAAWSVVPSPDVAPLNPAYTTINELLGVQAVSASTVWAVGYARYTIDNGNGDGTLIERWNGTSWSVVPSANGSEYNTLSAIAAVSPTQVWAVGHSFSQMLNDGASTLAEEWNGSGWHVASTPNANSPGQNYLNDVTSVPGSSQLWSVGYTQAYHGNYLSTLAECFC